MNHLSLQNLLREARKQTSSVVLDEGNHHIEVNSDGQQMTIKLSILEDNKVYRPLLEYIVGAQNVREISAIAKKITNHIDGAKVSKDLQWRNIEKYGDTFTPSPHTGRNDFQVEKLLLALKKLADYAKTHGIRENEELDKKLIAQVSQQILLEEPIGKNLEVSQKSAVKFHTYLLACVNQEVVQQSLHVTNQHYAWKPLLLRNTDYVNWTKSVIRHISSKAAIPNTPLFLAAGIKNPALQRVILNSLLRFSDMLKVK
ncbi:MAG: hypothetical protein LBJ94_02435 [Puniceicoccales bacterium]|jgi:hypothetical protein|nr:hypothetical protein [Puniceicoccales bacterium]